VQFPPYGTKVNCPGERSAAGLEHIRSLGETVADAQEASEAAQEDLLRQVDADYAARRITRIDVSAAYFAFRNATGAQPGFAVRWNALVRIGYRDTRNGIARPSNPDGTWSGPFPLPQSPPAPMAGMSVVCTLLDRADEGCCIGSTANLRVGLKWHTGNGKVFERWRAIPCASRPAAYSLESRMIAEHAPLLNATRGRR
jgi:hypothetical protein